MKYRLFTLLALSGVLFSSCVKENFPAEGGSILAIMENDDTRTSVTDEGRFTWSEGDKVWLHTTSEGVVGTLSSGAGTASANFSYGSYFGEMTGRAVYPYNEGHSISGDELSVVMPSAYDLGSNLTNTNAAMYGVNVGGTLKFNHMAGVMRFKFKNVPAGVNKFTITLDKKISGTFIADLTKAYPVIETSETSTASEKTITLNFTALTETSDIALYVPLPLGTYNSLELGLYVGNQSVWTYSNAVSNTISRKSLKLMPTVTLGGTIGGEIEGGEPRDYIDEYGINHGPGVKIGETVWAPVNCGYHATDYKYGKLYQWGRKYGHGYDGDATTSELIEGPVSLEVAQLKDNENKFYYISKHWLAVQNENLWNSSTDENPIKTEYDPCPEGWRVPTYMEFSELTSNYSSWTSDANGQMGYWFSGTESYSEMAKRVFFSAVGFHGYLDGAVYNIDHSCLYWSSRVYNNESAHNLGFYSFTVGIFNSYCANGGSVRCVQDDSPMVLVESVNLSKTSTTLSVGESETLSAAILPSNANHQHAHWSSDDPSVVTVDSEGKITAISIGTATITAMAGMQVATCIVTIESVSLEPEIVNLSDEGTANSYIVSKGGAYKFSAVKGNSTESVGAVASAEVLWESFGTDVPPSVGDLIKTASYKDGEITFQTSDTYKEGNAVIAAKDADGNILWSWHIWLTDQPQEQEYYNNTGTMMDRNLGATSATTGDAGALGLLYQWGRKDPFLGSSSISSDTVAKSTITWPSAVGSDSSNGTIAYATANPTTFIANNGSNGDWYYTGDSSTDNTRWTTSGNEKSVYDPCPSGWRVPDGESNGVWSKALGSSSSFTDELLYDSTYAGMNFSGKFGSDQTIWYPASGYRTNIDGSLLSVGYGGGYWSASPTSYGAFFLSFSSSGDVYPSNYYYYRALGYSVRCLQESK